MTGRIEKEVGQNYGRSVASIVSYYVHGNGCKNIDNYNVVLSLADYLGVHYDAEEHSEKNWNLYYSCIFLKIRCFDFKPLFVDITDAECAHHSEAIIERGQCEKEGEVRRMLAGDST